MDLGEADGRRVVLHVEHNLVLGRDQSHHRLLVRGARDVHAVHAQNAVADAEVSARCLAIRHHLRANSCISLSELKLTQFIEIRVVLITIYTN